MNVKDIEIAGGAANQVDFDEIRHEQQGSGQQRQQLQPLMPLGPLSSILTPQVNTPLLQALDRANTPKNHPPTSSQGWDGLILTSRTLTERVESKQLAIAGTDAVLLPYEGFDPKRPPVVLVHAFATPSMMRSLAGRLHAEGHQVYILLYNDIGATVQKCGEDMAQQLTMLRQRYYSEGTPLDIVSHCMGSVVARCALNTLHDPNWLTPHTDTPVAPRAGFGDVRLRTIDAPWTGFFHEPVEKTNSKGMQITKRVLEFMGVDALLEMRATSDVFAHLFDVQLEGVDFRNHAVVKPQGSTAFPTVAQFTDVDVLALARFLALGDLPIDPQMKNLCRTLEQEARYEDLRGKFHGMWAATGIALDEPSSSLTEHVVEVFDSAMPMYEVHRKRQRRDGSHANRSAWGAHMMAPADNDTQDGDVVDVISAELSISTPAVD